MIGNHKEVFRAHLINDTERLQAIVDDSEIQQ